jgi:DNA polymerase V
MRKKFSVLMQRTILELNGMPCIPLETEVATKQQLIFSRSFSTPVTSAARMHEVTAIYAQRASIRLAKDSQQAKLMTCFAGTGFRGARAPHHRSPGAAGPDRRRLGGPPGRTDRLR